MHGTLLRTNTSSVRSKDENLDSGLFYLPINQPLMIACFELRWGYLWWKFT